MVFTPQQCFFGTDGTFGVLLFCLSTLESRCGNDELFLQAQYKFVIRRHRAYSILHSKLVLTNPIDSAFLVYGKTAIGAQINGNGEVK